MIVAGGVGIARRLDNPCRQTESPAIHGVNEVYDTSVTYLWYAPDSAQGKNTEERDTSPRTFDTQSDDWQGGGFSVCEGNIIYMYTNLL